LMSRIELGDDWRVLKNSITRQALGQRRRPLLIGEFMWDQMIDWQNAKVGRGLRAPGLWNICDGFEIGVHSKLV